jgi:hypothetical protein
VEKMMRLREAMRRPTMIADDSGVTIIELMVASAILFIAAVGVVAALTFSASASAQSARRSAALDLATFRLEKARSIAYDKVGTVNGNPDGDLLEEDPPPGTAARADGFRIYTEVDWSRDASSGAAEYKNIKITVSWDYPRPGSISLASAIYGTTLLANVGDLRVFAREALTLNPIHMARVAVIPKGRTAQAIKFTSTTGEAFYGRIPIGVAKQVTVSASGWVFEPFTLPLIAPNEVTYLWVYARRPATAIIHVVDNVSGAPIEHAYVTLTGTSGTPIVLETGADGVAHFTGLYPYPDAYIIGVTARSRAPVSATIGPMTDGGSYEATITMMPPAPPGSLRIFVMDSTGSTPLNLAWVRLVGPSPETSEVAGSPLQTGTGGEVVFSGLDAGTYVIAATLEGKLETTGSVTVVSDVEQIATIKMREIVVTGNLDIIVQNDHNPPQPVTNHAVSWWTTTSGSSSNPVGTQNTDSSGHVHLTGLPTGSYSVKVGNTTRTGITVRAGETVSETFTH